MHTRIPAAAALLVIIVFSAGDAPAAEFLVGAASADITPAGPIPLDGQFHLRVAKTADTPITVNAIALESRDAGKSLDCAIMVSCDLVGVPADVLETAREKVHKRLSDIDTKKIFLNATHTHTAPVVWLDEYSIPKTGVMSVESYLAFLTDRIADAIERAWNGRKAGSVTWGLTHAVVAYNRRAVYADGTAKMYGRTDGPEFRNLEGYEDHDVNTLFFWNEAGKLIAMTVNVSCPSQEVENGNAVNADFWHPVREGLRQKFGTDVCILAWAGAAGDQSPHLMYRKAADDRMRQLRGLTRVDEIARRIIVAVEDAYDVVKNDRHADVPLIHKVENLRLPMRLVTEGEYTEAKNECDKANAAMAKNPKAADQVFRKMKWYEVTVQRWESQKTDPHPTHEIEIHVLRLGDAAIATNPFELFTDYGIRMKARSKAVQTFVIQLSGRDTYLPTEKAVRGGGYSGIVHSGLVGPEGGQILVDKTVEMINSMWPKGSEERLHSMPEKKKT